MTRDYFPLLRMTRRSHYIRWALHPLFVILFFHILFSCQTSQPDGVKLYSNDSCKEEIPIVKLNLILQTSRGTRWRVKVRVRVMVFSAIFDNISVLWWRSVLLVKESSTRRKPPTCRKSLTIFLGSCYPNCLFCVSRTSKMAVTAGKT